MTSMNSGNEMTPSNSSPKISSAMSTRPTGSTPTSCSTEQASALSRTAMSSCLLIWKSLLSSICSRIACIFRIVKPNSMSSRSTSATALTTSQSTPISMFITVSAARSTNTKKRTKQRVFSLPILVQMNSRLSRKTPKISKEYMDSVTLLKKSAPISDPFASCVKAIAKMYMMTTSRPMTKPTERMAESMPLMRIISSGMERSIRASRESRISRKSRRMEALPRPPVPPLPSRIWTVSITQVSMTIMKTRQESKTNHRSFNPSRFHLKAMNRTHHSKAK
mmetsp:Transcript_64219/g.206871  ORF Transcript_64219/g.206871 Transcript_64219/m.206871 type:complete len:279 (+) Transcript_64219:530-1366(+)